MEKLLWGWFWNQQDNKIRVFIYMQYGIKAMAAERPLLSTYLWWCCNMMTDGIHKPSVCLLADSKYQKFVLGLLWVGCMSKQPSKEYDDSQCLKF